MIPAWHRISTVSAVFVLACSAAAIGGTAAASASTASTASTATSTAADSGCPWVHSSAPVATRVSELLAKMTLDEKLTMVDGAGYANGTTGYVGHITADPSLCIPALNLEDGPAGVADGVPGVTQLPAPVALAASWNPSLADAYGGVVGSEAKAGISLIRCMVE